MSTIASVHTGASTTVLRLLHDRPETLGAGRLLCIDGPAGSGKTTLAAEVAGRTAAPVLHVDDMLEGWSGLARVRERIEPVLTALAAGRETRWRRWDWQHDRWAEERPIAPAPLLVLEGVGAGQRAWASSITTLVWVEAAPAVRRERGLARDGEGARAHWQRWMADEAAHFAAEGTRARADLVLDTSEREERA